MGNVKKEDRADGTEILRLNLVGLGLQAIGEIVGCHAATVSVKLKEMGVASNDTRRNFMEEVYNCLSEEEREWLADILYTSKVPIKDFVVQLLKERHRVAPPEPGPELTPLPTPSYPVSEKDLMELSDWDKSLRGLTGISDEIMNDVVSGGTGVIRVTSKDDKPEVTIVPVKDLFSE